MEKNQKSIRTLIAAILSLATVFTAAFCLMQNMQPTAAAPSNIVWNGAPDRAVAADIAAVQNTTRKNASGTKIPSNAHSADFPGIYFIWDSKQKDNGYLKVDANVFNTYASFTLTSKESNTYWDFEISPQTGQSLTADGCYVFFIPKVYNQKNINMVFIGAVTPVPTEEPTTESTTSSPRLVEVTTGDWVSSGNHVAQVQNSSYVNVPGTVVETGILYSTDPGMAADVTQVSGPAGSPFSLWATNIFEGIWYYQAYVKTAGGDYFYGEIKSATYP